MSTKTNKHAKLERFLDALDSWGIATQTEATAWKRLDIINRIIAGCADLTIDWCSACGGTGDITPGKLPQPPEDRVPCDCVDRYGFAEIDS